MTTASVPAPRVNRPLAATAPVIMPSLNPPPVIPRFDPVAMQQDTRKREPADAEELRFDLSLEIPSNDLLFRLEDEKKLQDRILQDFRDQGVVDPIDFPQLPTLSKTAFAGRNFNRSLMTVEPHCIVYNRLYFEEKNSERYGWDLGPIQPLVSLAAFYKDVFFFPHNWASHPFVRFDTNAGYALPGDPVPYLLYPPQITVTGALVQAGAIIGPAVIIP